MLDRTKQLLGSLRDGASHAVQATRDVSNSRGAAPLHAMIRQGADEIAQILPAFPESVKPSPEMGQLFEPTPQMVTENLTGSRPDYLTDRLGAAEAAPERQPHKELER